MLRTTLHSLPVYTIIIRKLLLCGMYLITVRKCLFQIIQMKPMVWPYAHIMQYRCKQGFHNISGQLEARFEKLYLPLFLYSWRPSIFLSAPFIFVRLAVITPFLANTLSRVHHNKTVSLSELRILLELHLLRNKLIELHRFHKGNTILLNSSIAWKPPYGAGILLLSLLESVHVSEQLAAVLCFVRTQLCFVW